MTAIGFAGLLLCLLWAWLRRNSDSHDLEEWLFATLAVCSTVAVCGGVFLWLWRVMP